MPLATKNNALILKDGKLAENCNCCGSLWQCCPDRSCAASEIKSVTIEITASDYYVQAEVRPFPLSLTYLSSGIPGSAMSGTHELPLLSVSGNGRKYFFGATFALSETQCAFSANVGISDTGFDWTVSYAGLAYLATPLATASERYKSLSQLQCSGDGVVNRYTYAYSTAGFSGSHWFGLCEQVSESLFVPFSAQMERCLPGGTANESAWVNKIENGSLNFSVNRLVFNR
jgi:hypothetical protein